MTSLILSSLLLAFSFLIPASQSMTQASHSNAVMPVFTEYRGVKIGMPATDVRSKLKEYLKAKGDQQDLLVLSESESAQVFYDDKGNVKAVSIDYLTRDGDPPTPMKVLGKEVEPRPDGSIYVLERYPAAGYWVSYNRTTGDNPLITITMQALR